MKVLFLFTNDLRLDDNLGFIQAIKESKTPNNNPATVLPVYILDRENPWPVQGASAWWLHHSLSSLSKDIHEIGGKLILREGLTHKAVQELALNYNADAVYFSRAYDPYTVSEQEKIRAWCLQNELACKRFPGNLLVEPETLKTQQGNYFQVFTPFYKSGLKLEKRRPQKFLKSELQASEIKSAALTELELLPQNPNWASDFDQQWFPGEKNAHKHLKNVLANIIENYSNDRDTPSIDGTSRLSPHLHFGELSAARIWDIVSIQLPFEKSEAFLRQLVWRDFNAHLLFHKPHIDKKPYKQKFIDFPWKKNTKHLALWQKGQTGYPIVDAGMRQLWQTGWMHNRVRMIVASFLTKHLGIHWSEGAQWFWDTLLDANLANNSGGWQWVAGCGADAAPYFRIFNPILQGEKFDKEGTYIRTWVPELKYFPKKYIHSPWTAPAEILAENNVTLGRNYPEPIVNHKESRDWALAAYKELS